ncbi:MAG: cupin domain-containing protein [Chloroflexota bacterium]
MTLTRSDFIASDDQRNEFYDELQGLSLGALWNSPDLAKLQHVKKVEPRPRAVPHVWRWDDVLPRALKAAELVGTQQAERRVLQFKNPGITERTATTNTLFAGIQIVMPGEVARAHRHSLAALRFIISSEGGYTNVEGEPIPMRPGDLVLTPNWTWHDHANDTTQPMIWMDGLDAPLVLMMEAAFQEEHPDERQPISAERGASISQFGVGGLQPLGAPPVQRHSPLTHFPWSETRPALERFAASAVADPHDGIIMQYTNPVDGGPVMPTLDCYIQMLRPGEKTAAHRHTSSAIYHVVAGQGCSVVGEKRLEWTEKDVFCVPNWTTHEHQNTSSTEPAFLFSFTDIPVLRAMDLLREESV